MVGISPLISVIMLIAFTLAVSGILFGWISQFTYAEREEFQTCSKAQISLQKAYYNPETGNINLVVQNTGRVDLKGFTVLISTDKSAETDRSSLEKEIKEGGIGLLQVKRSDAIRTIVVQAVECKNAQDMVTIYDVEGL